MYCCIIIVSHTVDYNNCVHTIEVVLPDLLVVEGAYQQGLCYLAHYEDPILSLHLLLLIIVLNLQMNPFYTTLMTSKNFDVRIELC